MTPDLASRVGPTHNSGWLLALVPWIPSLTEHSKMHYSHRKDFTAVCTQGPEKSQPSSFSSPLFLVARHSIAWAYNIYFYLFYLPLYLKSLGSAQDAGTGDFLGDKMFTKQCVCACVGVHGSSRTRSRPWMGTWVSA